MTEAHAILNALLPIILLLALGVVAAVGSRALRVSPIVGYLLLGLLLHAAGLRRATEIPTVQLLSELGVVFLLFDIGLHFSLAHIREQAKDIFVFGPVQVFAGMLGLGVVAMAAGLQPIPALFVGTVLALSSTAVVARLISERQQQSCPMGLTATAILVYQDVAAIFLLIVANAIGNGGNVAVASVLALAKATAAFGVAVLLARVLVRPVFTLVARGRNEEVFTAMALLVALGAAWATGNIGLSLTLGAFLGGMIIAETPYRAVIQAEIKPFRNLLLSFFFISVGLSLDPVLLVRELPLVLAVTLGLIVVKALTNVAASLTFQWSLPGSVQLGLLLAQGSEFAFVVLSVPAVRGLVGEDRTSVLISAVALSLAVTPSLAELGRSLAGRMRSGHRRRLELQPLDVTGPVLVVGMDQAGRTVADALERFEIGYVAVERDQERLEDAIADGYRVVFGDLADPRLWEPMAMYGRRVVALTEPRLDVVLELSPMARALYPDVLGVALTASRTEAERFEKVGVRAVIDDPRTPGLPLAEAVLAELGTDPDAIASWARQERQRASSDPGAVLVAA